MRTRLTTSHARIGPHSIPRGCRPSLDHGPDGDHLLQGRQPGNRQCFQAIEDGSRLGEVGQDILKEHRPLQKRQRLHDDVGIRRSITRPVSRADRLGDEVGPVPEPIHDAKEQRLVQSDDFGRKIAGDGRVGDRLPCK